MRGETVSRLPIDKRRGGTDPARRNVGVAVQLALAGKSEPRGDEGARAVQRQLRFPASSITK